MNQEDLMNMYGFRKGQKVIYIQDNHPMTVTIESIGTYLDKYDTLNVEEFDGFILPSDVYTREGLATYFEGERYDLGCSVNLFTLVTEHLEKMNGKKVMKSETPEDVDKLRRIMELLSEVDRIHKGMRDREEFE